MTDAPAADLSLTPRQKIFEGGFPYWHEVVLALLLAALMAVAGYLDPRFVQPSRQLMLSTHVWELALLALPMTFIIVTGGIDLSVGSMIALSGVVLGLSHEAGMNIWLCCALAILTGTAAGALNGVFVSFVRVHPLIVTLATLSAYRGIAEGISSGRPLSGFPENFAWLGRGDIAGVPVAAIIFVVAAIVAGVVLWKTPFGRSLYAMGYNETATRFSGIRTRKIKFILYAMSGVAAAVAAILLVGRRNTAKADIGAQMELDVITAVVLGGTSIFGGRGRILGTVLGVLLIHETKEFVSWYFQNDPLIPLVVGALLIVAVLINSALTPRGRE
ncbi:MAG: rhamnose transport system permease protein [Phycisphaerales bacterium]|jgi:rhamnose transport system permease protein|nr:rhamnose transport system permease protein [Phycisphaerales bacterium]